MAEKPDQSNTISRRVQWKTGIFSPCQQDKTQAGIFVDQPERDNTQLETYASNLPDSIPLSCGKGRPF